MQLVHCTHVMGKALKGSLVSSFSFLLSQAIPASPSPSTSSPPYSTVDPPSSSSSPGPSPRPSVIANKLQKPQNAPTVRRASHFPSLLPSRPPACFLSFHIFFKIYFLPHHRVIDRVATRCGWNSGPLRLPCLRRRSSTWVKAFPTG